MGNEEKRTQYDQFGNNFSNFQGTQGFQGFDFDIGDMFGDFFGFGKKDINKGKDIEIDIQIDLQDTLKAINRTIDLKKNYTCQRCHGSGAEQGSNVKECFSCRGTGHVQQVRRSILGNITRRTICPECHGQGRIPEKPCNVCKGEGRIIEREKIDIHIPAGVDTGQVIKMSGMGEAGKRGGQEGDLYIKILVKPHPVFIREGDNLIIEKEISFSQASLGDEVDIPTLEGKPIILKVPAGTESGKVLRIIKKGIPNFSGWGIGDLYVKLNIQIPKKLNRKQKELLEKLKKEGI